MSFFFMAMNNERGKQVAINHSFVRKRKNEERERESIF